MVVVYGQPSIICGYPPYGEKCLNPAFCSVALGQGLKSRTFGLPTCWKQHRPKRDQVVSPLLAAPLIGQLQEAVVWQREGAHGPKEGASGHFWTKCTLCRWKHTAARRRTGERGSVSEHACHPMNFGGQIRSMHGVYDAAYISHEGRALQLKRVSVRKWVPFLRLRFNFHNGPLQLSREICNFYP